MEWQPIETAPKSDRILVWSPIFQPGQAICARWDDDLGSMKPRPFWRTDNYRTAGITGCRNRPPTHWMPLPAKPEAA